MAQHSRGRVRGRPSRPAGGAVVAAAKPRVQTGQRGSAGLYTLGGVLTMGQDVDYLEAMRPPKRFESVNRMMSDATVRAAFMAWTMPILATKRSIVPGGTGPEDKLIADHIKDDLWGTSTAPEQIRYEELLSLPYGVVPHEKVWEIREDNLLHLRNLAYLPPSSIAHDGWKVDDHGGPAGVIQVDSNTGKLIPIEIAGLLLHIHNRVGGNIVGESFFRAAYKPWWYKDKLESVAAVAVERGAAGIPVGKQSGSDPATKRYIETVLKAVRTHQLAFIRETDDFTFRFDGINGQVIDPLPFIKFHAAEIFRSVLAQHIALGGSETGSWALAKSDIDFLVMAIQAVIERIEATYNRYLIEPWVNYNWPNVPRNAMPKLAHSPLSRHNLKDWFGAVELAVATNILQPDEQVAQMGRDMLGVPERIVDAPHPQTQDELDAEKPAEEGEQDGGVASRRSRGVRRTAIANAADTPRLESLIKLEALGLAPDWTRMTKALDGGRDRIIKRVAALQAKQAKRLTAIGVKLVRAGDAAGIARLIAGDGATALAAAGSSSKAARLVSYDEEAAVFLAEMVALYDHGVDEVGSELEQQGLDDVADVDEEARIRDREVLVAGAIVAAALLADRMQNAWAAECLRQLRSGVDPAALQAQLEGLSGKLLEDLASQRSNSAFATGRGSAIAANGEAAEALLYTAVMDVNTCRGHEKRCWERDGTTYAVGEEPAIPNPDCLGKDRCRCQLVPLVKR